MRAREVEQPPDHALVLSAMFPSLTLEELDASLAQYDGDFGALLVALRVGNLSPH